MLRILILAGLLMVCSGCRAPGPLGKTAVAWRTHLDFQPVSALDDPPEVSVHEIRIDRKSMSVPLLGQIEVEGDRFVCAGITPSGLRVFLVEFDDQGLVYEKHPLLPRLMKGKYLLGDLQCIYWPADHLRAGGLTVREPDAHTRIISRGPRDVIQIWYETPGRPFHSAIRYENRSRKYTISIEPVE